MRASSAAGGGFAGEIDGAFTPEVEAEIKLVEVGLAPIHGVELGWGRRRSLCLRTVVVLSTIGPAPPHRPEGPPHSMGGDRNVTGQTLNDLVRCRRGISPEMAIRLDRAFSGGADTWMRMQAAYDLAQARKKAGSIKVKRYQPTLGEGSARSG